MLPALDRLADARPPRPDPGHPGPGPATIMLQNQTGRAGKRAKDYDLFILGEQLVIDLPAPATVRAAAYRMMADLDGAQSLGPVTDQRGRAGVAVGLVRRDDGGWVQSRLVIDPGSDRALAGESWFCGSGAPAGAPSPRAPAARVNRRCRPCRSG